MANFISSEAELKISSEQSEDFIAQSAISLKFIEIYDIMNAYFLYQHRKGKCKMKVYHYTDKANLDSIMQSGLKTTSRYESFTELRKDVVFCWLSPSDNKIFSEDTICLEITVDENDCIVASMDYISFAMMYKYGGAKYGGMNIPINERASELFVKLYETTAIPLSQYKDGNLFSPEVLVKGNITPANILICVDK